MTGSVRASAAIAQRYWLGVLALVVLVQGAASWHYDFIDLDDAGTIIDHELVNGLGQRPWLDYVRPERFGGLPEYMPLKTLSLAVDRWLFGPSPAAFRAQQQLWYWLSACGFWLWASRLLTAWVSIGKSTLSRRDIGLIASFASLLFVVHPVHVESVTWLSGRKDVMCGAFMLATLWLALLAPLTAARSAALCACAALAMLSKPVGATIIVCLVVQDAMVQPREHWRTLVRTRAPSYVLIAIMSVLFALVYTHVAVDGGQSIRPEALARVYTGPTWFRQLQQVAWFVRYGLLPFGLSPELPTSLLGPRLSDVHAWFFAVLGAGVMVGTLLGTLRGSAVGGLLALYVAPLLPILIRPPWAQYLAGRYLFLSVAPLALGLTWGAFMLTQRAPRLRPLILSTQCAVFIIWGLEHRAYDASFRDSFSLWTQASAQFPESSSLAQRAAQAAVGQGRFQIAARYYERCVSLTPTHPLCAAQYGTMLLGSDDTRARAWLTRALPFDETGLAHRGLAFTWAASGRAADGAKLYRDWLASHRVDAERVKPMIGLALASADHELAHKALRKLLQVMTLETPAKPPPVALFERTAQALHEPELSLATQQAAARCVRVDCFFQRMYGASPPSAASIAHGH